MTVAALSIQAATTATQSALTRRRALEHTRDTGLVTDTRVTAEQQGGQRKSFKTAMFSGIDGQGALCECAGMEHAWIRLTQMGTQA